MELFVLLRFHTFLFEEICDLWSDAVWLAMDGVVFLLTEVSHGEAKRFVVARRETHKRIASFKETKYDFSL